MNPRSQNTAATATANRRRLKDSIAALQAGDFALARQLVAGVLAEEPDNFDARHLAAVIASETRQLDEALRAFDAALALRPGDPEVLINRGLTCQKIPDLEQALADFDRAITAAPAHVNAWRQRAHTLQRLQRYPAAIAAYDRVLASEPADARTWHERGITLQQMGRFADALESQDKAIAIAPDCADYHATRGAALSELRRFKDAIAAYDRAIALQPAHASAWSNRANTLSELGDHRGALDSFDRALALNPSHIDARFNRGLCRLLLGRFRDGWDDYRWRWKRWESEYVPTREQPYPLLTPENVHAPVWDGRPTPGRLLIWPEQGIGDQMLFASMLTEAQQRVGALTLALDPRLHTLFARSFPDARIVTLEKAFVPGRFDCQIPFGNLGGIFRSSESDFLVHRRPYLKADPARTGALRRLLTAGGKRVCGIAWHSRHEKVGPDKSMRLTDLVPLLSLPGYRFIDLQYGDHAAEHDALRREAGLALARVPEIDNWNDIDGLAALINACDLIITVSNTTAHIAGALGKSVLLMLPYSTGRYWYWQTEREDSLVYPDLRIFRQSRAGDWTTVAAAVRAAAQARMTNGSNSPGPAITTGRLPNPKVSLSHAQRQFDDAQFGEALDSVNHALGLDPRLGTAHNLRGNVLMALGRYADAGAAYEQAMALSPDSAIAANNLSLCRLMTGDFRKAWDTHGARWQAWQQMGMPDITPPDYTRLQRWTGQALAGSLLVWGEQGIGDQILWCSLLAEARTRVSSLTVAAHPKLQTLFKRSFAECEVTTADRAGPLRRHAAQITMGDLGALFRHSEADFLAHRCAYLQADKARTAALRLQLGSNGQPLCGLSWLSRNPRSSALKSIDFAQLSQLLSLSGFHFINLQHDSGIDPVPALTEVDSIDKWNDIDGLAALIAACDVIVTASNTVAHLAGALGQRVLLLLPARPYWYWQPDRRDSLWYPNVEVFRQTASGDWSDVLHRVAKTLAPPERRSRAVAHITPPAGKKPRRQS